MTRPHQIDGKLAGQYKTLLAASSTAGEGSKRLWHVLNVADDNSYSSGFEVDCRSGKTEVFSSLSSSIRYYEDQP